MQELEGSKAESTTGGNATESKQSQDLPTFFKGGTTTQGWQLALSRARGKCASNFSTDGG